MCELISFPFLFLLFFSASFVLFPSILRLGDLACLTDPSIGIDIRNVRNSRLENFLFLNPFDLSAIEEIKNN